MEINPMNYNLKPVRNMPRISRKEFGENLDEILEKVEKENIGYVIHDEGSKDLVLCPARWYSYCFDENFGDMLICAVHGVIEFQGNAFDFVCAFIRKHLPVIDITSLEHLAMSIEDLMKDQTDEHKLTTGRLILDDIHRQIEDIKNAHKGK